MNQSDGTSDYVASARERARAESKADKAPKEKRKKTKAEEKAAAEKHARLVSIKADVKMMEKDNTDSVIAFSSGYPWFKIGFHSALIYEFFVAPKFKNPPYKLRNDVDHYHFSKVGVVSVNNLLKLADMLVKVGATLPESLEEYFENGRLKDDVKLSAETAKDYYVFKIKGMSKAKIKTYMEERFREEKELNELVLPFYIPQHLYPDMRYLAQMIADLSTRLPNNVHSYTTRLVDLSLDCLRDLNASCNGYGDHERSYIRTLGLILYRCSDMIELLRVLMDIRVIKPGACTMILKLILTVQTDAKAELEKVQQKGENPVVEAIKRAKNFPKLDGVDLSDKFPPKDEDAHGYIE